MGGILVVSEIKAAPDQILGRKVALSSVYNLLYCHDWRKLAPDKRHSQSDLVVQQEWKRTSSNTLANPPLLGTKARATFVSGMMTHEYICVFGAVDVCIGEPDSLILPYVNTECKQLFLDEVSARHPDEKIVMVIDGAGWHRSNTLKVSPNIHLLPLPPYASELHPIEHIWGDLREKFFHNRIFKNLNALENHLSKALRAYEQD